MSDSLNLFVQSGCKRVSYSKDLTILIPLYVYDLQLKLPYFLVYREILVSWMVSVLLKVLILFQMVWRSLDHRDIRSWSLPWFLWVAGLSPWIKPPFGSWNWRQTHVRSLGLLRRLYSAIGGVWDRLLNPVTWQSRVDRRLTPQVWILLLPERHS